MKKESKKEPLHKMPSDLQKAINSSREARGVWEYITPLARTEGICWLTTVKKDETRSIRIQKAVSNLKDGMRRPCCWSGCIHR